MIDGVILLTKKSLIFNDDIIGGILLIISLFRIDTFLLIISTVQRPLRETLLRIPNKFPLWGIEGALQIQNHKLQNMLYILTDLSVVFIVKGGEINPA